MPDIRDHGGILGGTGSGNTVKNVIRGTTTIPVNSASILVTIPNVDTSKSIVMVTSLRTAFNASNINPSSVATTAKITATNGLTLARINSYAEIIVSWVVIEFKSVKAFFNVRTTLTSGELTKNITTPNMSGGQVLIFASYQIYRENTSLGDYTALAPTLIHDGSTTLTVSRGYASGGNTIVECYVISV